MTVVQSRELLSARRAQHAGGGRLSHRDAPQRPRPSAVGRRSRRRKLSCASLSAFWGGGRDRKKSGQKMPSAGAAKSRHGTMQWPPFGRGGLGGMARQHSARRSYDTGQVAWWRKTLLGMWQRPAKRPTATRQGPPSVWQKRCDDPLQRLAKAKTGRCTCRGAQRRNIATMGTAWIPDSSPGSCVKRRPGLPRTLWFIEAT